MNTAFDSISIKIASPDQIKDSSKQTSCKRRSPSETTDGPFTCPEKGTCSCGEVKKAETINYRSFRPEPEGLFCEAIFGPQKDWECNCGKYKRIKHKGVICDRCGVEITQQRVRRDRLGYIQLAALVSHIWYFKGNPSRIGVFCGLSSRQLESVLYFEAFYVLETAKVVAEVFHPDCPLEVDEIVTHSTIGDTLLLGDQITDDSQLSKTDYLPIVSTFMRYSEDELLQMERDYPGLKAQRAGKAIAENSSQTPETTHQGSEIGDSDGYVITEVFNPQCPLKVGEHISYEEYQEALKDYPGWTIISPSFVPGDVVSETEYNTEVNKLTDRLKDANSRMKSDDLLRSNMGAEAIHEVLRNIDLEAEKQVLTEALEKTTSHQNKLKIAKHLNHVADFAEAEQRPEWMILDVIPVIPPDLRPLVPLEGGRFATSDLNDLYRRVINRNNRLRKLIQLRSPEVILRNEKRMLQEAVDAFFDNGRHGRRVTGPGNRPLKSLAEVLKGKIGRFRQNLLGKRVDYSGRSVIVVGPELGLHQCGIPKRMAVELFKPFIIERLQAYGYTQTIKRAKHIAEHVDSDSPVWEVVEEVIADHPVLLNRPPTLHRLGIQAFLPVLVEGKSIRIPPLVCKAFNADFDGDQMAVHVPLTVEAQAEAKLLMLSTHNILKPSHGDPIAVPELDMVLGPSFLTKTLSGHTADAILLHEAYITGDAEAFEAFRDKPWYHRRFAHREDVITAHAAGQLKLHDSIQLFCPSNEEDETEGPMEPILTTVGRVIFNEVLPPELEWEDEHSQQRIPFFNAEAGGRELSALIHRCFNELGTRVTTEVLEKVQKLAFEYATLSGISPGITDYITPDNRNELVNTAKAEIEELLEGAPTTESEEYENEQIRIWLNAKDSIEKEMFDTLPQIETSLVERGDPRKVHPYVDPTGSEIDDKTVQGFSPVHIMADSGARARKDPFMQISAFVGLKAKQDGDILIPPIGTSTYREGDLDLPNYFCSYREGLDMLDYFNSTYGSRKGLVDTALKTAHSGYLTRRLVDVAQDVRITAEDCHTLNGIQKFATEGGDLAFKISGRTAAEDIIHPESGEVLVPASTLISAQMASQIEILRIKVVRVRSVLTCQTDEGVCAKCYGTDLTTNSLVNVGEAVGIIAAQSIGEPGTQLTMRTFHTGGAVEDVSEARQHRILSKVDGTVHFRDFQDGRTVKQERDLWIAIENRANLDGPAYKVQKVNRDDCQLQEGELLSEKQYSENAERYKGFDTKPWQYKVTDVLDGDCSLEVGTQLSQTEYAKALAEYGFQRFVTPHYRVTQVQHADISATVGDLLTEEEARQRKNEIRQGFDVELYYLDPKTGELVKEEDLKGMSNASLEQTNVSADSEADDTGFKRVYRVTDIDKNVQKNFPFKVGQEVPAQEITPWLTPFEVDSKPIYVVNKDIPGGASLLEQTVLASDRANSDASPLKVGAELSTTDYERACTAYRDNGWAFKVEKQDVERYSVIAVYHPDCPLEIGAELTAAETERLQRRYPGVDAPKLQHRVTTVYHPDCPLEPGTLLTDSEKKAFGAQYPAVAITETQPEPTIDTIEAERLYCITAVNHSDCPLKVGERLTAKETSAHRRHYKGFDVECYYEVMSVEDETPELTVGQHLTESEYRELRRSNAKLAEKATRQRYRVERIHHPDLETELEVGAELTKDEYQKYNRKFKGFDTDIDAYRVIADKRNIDTRLKPGDEVPPKEYRELKKESQRAIYTVTDVYYSNVMTADTSNPNRDRELERARFVPSGYQDAVSTDQNSEASANQSAAGTDHYRTYSGGDELPKKVSDDIKKGQYPGFEVDELSLRMRIEVETANGTRVPHVIPADYSFSLSEGDSIRQGETLAELHERTANLDIVAGIPRVTDLFEARRLKRGDAAQIAEIEGYVRSAGTKGGVPQYRIEHRTEHGEYVSRPYQIPDEKRRVAEGDWVDAGEPLTSGFLNPHDILSIGRTTIDGVPVEGEEAVWAYLVDEVQKVYGKGTINDKHVETIVRQMLTKIRITEPGDTDFYPNDEVQRKRFERINSEIVAEGGTPATGEPILQSISKASLSTDSFISAASFQQTTKVLTDAAVSGQTDKLFGLKENVILGRLIPAGSGFSDFQNLEISDVEQEIAEASDDD